jgi:hypothetical protein
VQRGQREGVVQLPGARALLEHHARGERPPPLSQSQTIVTIASALPLGASLLFHSIFVVCLNRSAPRPWCAASPTLRALLVCARVQVDRWVV